MAEKSPIDLSPGVHHGISFEDYQALQALNQSTLKLIDPMRGSPKHARAAYENKLERNVTDALRLGQREHCWIVEGEDVFRQRYVISQPCSAIIKSKPNAGKVCGKAGSYLVDVNNFYNLDSPDWSTKFEKVWRCGTHAPKDQEPEENYVTEEEVAGIRNMAEAIHSHEINIHLKRRGWSEATIVYYVDVQVGIATCPECGGWEHPKKFKVGWEQWRCWRCQAAIVPKFTYETRSLLHKTRLDRLAEPTSSHPHTIIELKRMPVLKGSRFEREKTIRSYGWDVQAAMEVEAVKIAADVNECQFLWLFIEEGYPYDVTWFPASEDTLRVGREKLAQYRRLWTMSEVTNHWPGRCVGVQPAGGLPEREIQEFLKKFADDKGVLPSEVGN